MRSRRRNARLWVADKVKKGVDVIICHPRLVQTGLDLVDFPTIVWYETDYSVYTMRQASRRSWRIGQTRPVKVIFMAYRSTLQADALKLVAQKLQSSLAVEGELPEDGLAAYGDDGDDLMLALARKLVNGEEDDAADTVEAAFAQARAAETESESYLVDEGWKAPDPITPSIVEVHPAAETEYPLQAAANAEPGGEEPQRSLFSWAEFIAEPVQSRRRNGSPSPQASRCSSGRCSRRRSARDARPSSSRGGRRYMREGLPARQISNRQRRKEKNQWHACLCTTTESSRTPTPR